MLLPCKNYANYVPQDPREVARQALETAMNIDSEFKTFDAPVYRLESPKSYFKLVGELCISRKKLAAALFRTPDSDFGLHSYRLDGGLDLVLTPPAERDGAWQVTSFHCNGEPWENQTCDTKMQGIEKFLSECILKTVCDRSGWLLTDAQEQPDECLLPEQMNG